MKICVVGVGYVGLVTGACFSEFGVNVACLDVDEPRIELLKKGEIPFYEPGLKEIVQKNMKEGRLTFTTDPEECFPEARVIFIAVGTPSLEGGGADLKYVREVAATIGRLMNGYKVIATKSTVPVGTGEEIARVIRENMEKAHDFDMVSNPEFLREGSAVEDFMRPDRVVIGAQSKKAEEIMKELFRPLYIRETPFVITDVKTAEMIKYASNAFLAAKISFINEVANLCDMVGADVHVVARAMGLDGRISPKFLHPGPGFGGSCFPKDTSALVEMAEKAGYDFKLVRAVMEVNRAQRKRMVEKIARLFGGGLAGKRVAVLGLAFKPNTDDMRDAPSIDIIRRMREQGADIVAFDPAAREEAEKVIEGIEYAKNSYDAAEGAHGVVIITEWNQFRMLDWERMKSLMAGDVVADLRNICDPPRMRELGFTYTGVGRG